MEKKNSNSKVIIILVIFIILLLCVLGYFCYDKFIGKENNNESKKVQENKSVEKKLDLDNSVVQELYKYFNFDTSIGCGYSVDYLYNDDMKEVTIDQLSDNDKSIIVSRVSNFNTSFGKCSDFSSIVSDLSKVDASGISIEYGCSENMEGRVSDDSILTISEEEYKKEYEKLFDDYTKKDVIYVGGPNSFYYNAKTNNYGLITHEWGCTTGPDYSEVELTKATQKGNIINMTVTYTYHSSSENDEKIITKQDYNYSFKKNEKGYYIFSKLVKSDKK